MKNSRKRRKSFSLTPETKYREIKECPKDALLLALFPFPSTRKLMEKRTKKNLIDLALAQREFLRAFPD